MLSMLKGVHRRALGLDKDDKVMAPHGFATGGDGQPSIVFPSPNTVAIFDDFLSQGNAGIGVNDTGLAPNTITDTGLAGQHFFVRTYAAATKGLQDSTNGIYRFVGTANGGTPQTNMRAIVGQKLAWKPNQGPGGQSGRLRFGARVRMSPPTHVNTVFMGFTDEYRIDTGTAEFPIYDTGATAGVLSDATDAVGFLFGNNAGVVGWRGVSVAADVDQAVTLTDTGPVTNKWNTYELEVIRGNSDTGGSVVFYIDGIPKGRISSPVTSSVALVPFIGYSDTGQAVTFDIDWVNVSAPRDTGA